jgi:hypothetical protein
MNSSHSPKAGCTIKGYNERWHASKDGLAGRLYDDPAQSDSLLAFGYFVKQINIGRKVERPTQTKKLYRRTDREFASADEIELRFLENEVGLAQVRFQF